MSALGKWLALALVVLVLDLVTKHLAMTALDYRELVPVVPGLSWVHLHNTGAAFSLLADAGGWQRWLLAGVAVLFCALLVWELHRLAGQQPWQALAFALILGGALGNLHDRLRWGYVEDFILVHWQDWYFPAFNVADAGISVGAALWLLLLLRESLAARRAGPANPS